MTDQRQELLDRFYMQNGDCCAGCDWWHHINGLVGECSRSSPVDGAGRFEAIGISGMSCVAPAGLPLTKRSEYCGEFKDSFDWSSLPQQYRNRINCTK